MKGVTVQQALDAWRRKCEEEKKDAIGRPQVVRTKKKRIPYRTRGKRQKKEKSQDQATRDEARHGK